MRSRPTLSQLGDDWYQSEPRTRDAIKTELRRARGRFAARPLPVLLLAALLSFAVMYRITHKQRTYPAEVVLALTEGTMVERGKSGVPADALRAYVTEVLMSEANLVSVIEKHDLFRLRERLGPQWAVAELWSQTHVEIWKNSFIHYHEWDAHARKSARIGITFYDHDPDRAFAVAQDLARVVIATHDARRLEMTSAMAREVKLARDTLEARLRDLTTAIAVKQTALAEAHKARKQALVAALHVDLTALDSQVEQAEDQLALIAASPEAIADQVSKAGLDVTLDVVEERRPERNETSAFALVLIGAVVVFGCLLVSALIVGAFDTRIHDTDDVERLGLPVLGHVPAFAGDRVGSLRARGVSRPTGSVMRWLSLK